MLVSSSTFIRSDILWLLPAIGIAFYQVKIVWGKLTYSDSKDTEIPGEYKEFDQFKINYFIYLTYSLLFLQLPLVILPMQTIPSIDITLKALGYLLISGGLVASLTALSKLKNNWTGMQEYRIKKGQTLTTSGPYKFIRHPIYASTIYELIGFELVAGSWLFLLPLFLGFYFIYKHSLKEEALLEKKFGEEFREYKKKTKMFIPFIF